MNGNKIKTECQCNDHLAARVLQTAGATALTTWHQGPEVMLEFCKNKTYRGAILDIRTAQRLINDLKIAIKSAKKHASELEQNASPRVDTDN